MDREALTFADPDDLVSAGHGQIVGATGQDGRGPQQLSGRIGHHLHVHSVPAVLVGVVGPAVADPVALREGPVEQHISGSAPVVPGAATRTAA